MATATASRPKAKRAPEDLAPFTKDPAHLLKQQQVKADETELERELRAMGWADEDMEDVHDIEHSPEGALAALQKQIDSAGALANRITSQGASGSADQVATLTADDLEDEDLLDEWREMAGEGAGEETPEATEPGHDHQHEKDHGQGQPEATPAVQEGHPQVKRTKTQSSEGLGVQLEMELDFPCSVRLMESLAVLDKTVVDYSALLQGNKDAPPGMTKEDLEDEISAAKLKISLLQNAAQFGQMRPEEYVAKVKRRVSADVKLAVQLKKMDRLEEAKRVVGRVQIMKSELKEFEQPPPQPQASSAAGAPGDAMDQDEGESVAVEMTADRRKLLSRLEKRQTLYQHAASIWQKTGHFLATHRAVELLRVAKQLRDLRSRLADPAVKAPPLSEIPPSPSVEILMGQSEEERQQQLRGLAKTFDQQRLDARERALSCLRSDPKREDEARLHNTYRLKFDEFAKWCEKAVKDSLQPPPQTTTINLTVTQEVQLEDIPDETMRVTVKVGKLHLLRDPDAEREQETEEIAPSSVFDRPKDDDFLAPPSGGHLVVNLGFPPSQPMEVEVDMTEDRSVIERQKTRPVDSCWGGQDKPGDDVWVGVCDFAVGDVKDSMLERYVARSRATVEIRRPRFLTALRGYKGYAKMHRPRDLKFDSLKSRCEVSYQCWLVPSHPAAGQERLYLPCRVSFAMRKPLCGRDVRPTTLTWTTCVEPLPVSLRQFRVQVGDNGRLAMAAAEDDKEQAEAPEPVAAQPVPSQQGPSAPVNGTPAAQPPAQHQPEEPATAALPNLLQLADASDVMNEPFASHHIVSVEVCEDLLDNKWYTGVVSDADALASLLEATQARMEKLMNAIQEGDLTFDQYVEANRQAVTRDKHVAASLSRAGRKPEALVVLKRVKVMQDALEQAG